MHTFINSSINEVPFKGIPFSRHNIQTAHHLNKSKFKITTLYNKESMFLAWINASARTHTHTQIIYINNKQKYLYFVQDTDAILIDITTHSAWKSKEGITHIKKLKFTVHRSRRGALGMRVWITPKKFLSPYILEKLWSHCNTVGCSRHTTGNQEVTLVYVKSPLQQVETSSVIESDIY